MTENKDFSKHKENLYIKANIAALEQDYLTTIELQTEALFIDSEFADALISRALAYEALGNKDSAIKDYKEAIEILQKKLHNLKNEIDSLKKDEKTEQTKKNTAQILTKQVLNLCSENEKKLYRYIARYKKVSSSQARKVLNLQKSRTTDLLNSLLEKKLILKHGNGRAVYYTTCDQDTENKQVNS